MEERLSRRPEAIQAMFAGIADHYDALNRVLSLRRDVAWRRRLVEALEVAPEGPILDLACGTGDVALGVDGREVVGGDFCVDMLVLARRKAARRGHRLGLAAADALSLPFADATFAAVTVAFGVRNFADLDRGLREIRRVLRPAGVAAILEFQRPSRRLVGALADAWNRLVVTPLGRAVSRDGEAYAYLPASVATFPTGDELLGRLTGTGFTDVRGRELTGGIAVLTVARRGEEP
ncbi:MAG: ubiquinone/menaquinone biosynthesis methyltransferase [Acidobacteriota bacterium]